MINIKIVLDPRYKATSHSSWHLKSEMKKPCRFGPILTSPVDFEKNSPPPNFQRYLKCDMETHRQHTSEESFAYASNVVCKIKIMTASGNQKIIMINEVCKHRQILLLGILL